MTNTNDLDLSPTPFLLKYELDIETARKELTQQALRMVDKKWAEREHIVENSRARAELEALSKEEEVMSVYGIGKGWGSKKIPMFTADVDDYENPYLFAGQLTLTDGEPWYHHRTGERVYRVEPALRSYITKYGTANGEMPLGEVRIGETWQGVKDKGSRAVDQVTAAAEKEGALLLLGKTIFSLVSLESAKEKGLELGQEIHNRGGKVFVPDAMNYGFPSDKERVDRLQGDRAAQIGHSADDALFKTEITFTVGTGLVGSVYAQAGKQAVKQGLDEITDIASETVKRGNKGDTLVDAGDIRVGGRVPNNLTSIDPNKIRFSQISVSYLKQRPGQSAYTLDDLILSMKTKGWKGDPVDVVRMSDGSLSSIDNTRILAAREAGIDAKVTIRSMNERLPQVMIDQKRFTHKGQAAETWGEAMQIRITRQKGNFATENPLGSYQPPKITYPKIKWQHLLNN